MKNTTSTSELFELCTVPYPMPINGIFVTKHIDFWRNGRFRQGRKLIGDRTRNLEGNFLVLILLLTLLAHNSQKMYLHLCLQLK